MKRIIPVILVLVFLAGTGISNANTAVYIQETHLGAKNFFSAASAGSTPGEIRNNHTLKSHKRTVASSVTVDQNGNTTQKGTQKFYYDYQNRVVRTADSQGTTTSEIKYDALGRRTQKIIGTETLNYYYDGDMVIEERDGSDQVLRQYVNGNQIDEVCAIANYVNGIYANTYYVHTDGIGSTTAVTDQAGNIVERVSYDVYGQPTFTDGSGTVIPGSTIGNTVLFQGRRYDTETNLYYFRARHYDPTMGRFLSVDPLGYKDSMNLYQAFGMNGVNFTDPMGLNKGTLEEVNWVLSQPDIIAAGDFIEEDFNNFLSNFKSKESFLQYCAWWMDKFGRHTPVLSFSVNTAEAVTGKTVTGDKLNGHERVVRGLWAELEVLTLYVSMLIEPKTQTFNHNSQTHIMKERPNNNIDGQSQVKITRESLSDNISGYTQQGNRVAKAIKENDIDLNVLGDELFEKFYKNKTGELVAPKACAKGVNIYVRKNSEHLLSEIVHEGTHALDYIDDLIYSILKLEKRAYFFERQFQIAKKMRVEFEKISDMLIHIFKNY